LTIALKNASWNAVTKDVKEYYAALLAATNIEERAKAMNDIAYTINQNLGAAIDTDWVEKNLDLIGKWYNSSG
jgi:hypothetical protein